MLKTFAPLLLMIFCSFPQIQAQIFKAGAAVRDITPDHLIPISERF